MPAGGLAFPVVANVRGCRPGALGSARGHSFLGWGFWGELPEPALGVAVWALGLLWHSGWGGTGSSRRWEWPRPGLAAAALQLVLCHSHAPLECEMLLQNIFLREESGLL